MRGRGRAVGIIAGLAFAFAPGLGGAGVVFEDEDAPELSSILGARLRYESEARMKYRFGDGKSWTGADDEYKETGEIYLSREDAGILGRVRHHRYSRNDQIAVVIDGNLRSGDFSWLAEQPYDYLPAMRGKASFAAGRLVIEWPAARPFRRTEFVFRRGKHGIECELHDGLVASGDEEAELRLENLTYRYRPPKAFVRSECSLRRDEPGP